MNQCRVAITTKCNLKCKYCCMEYSHIQETFTKVDSIQDILEYKNYDVFAITGGEPTIVPRLLQDTMCEIKMNTDARIHLWTNGIELYPEFVSVNKDLIDGINISIHDGSWNYVRWTQLNQIMPIRLHIWENLSTDMLREFCQLQNIKLNEWVMDECDINEDRFILEER